MRYSFALLLVVMTSLLGPACTADEWQEPKDGLFTEKQLTNYVGAFKEWQEVIKAYGKAVDGSKSGAGALIMIAGMEDKLTATMKKHDLTRAEFDWLSGKVTECLSVAMLDEGLESGRKDLGDQKKKMADDLEAARKKLATYQEALKANARVMTKEQREEAVKSAKEGETSALDETKQHGLEAKEAGDEAAKAEGEAKTADGLAKNPPSDVGADDKEEYVKARKEDATNARNTAKEARDKEKEARKAEAESKAKAATAVKQAAHPETPLTDDEKAQVKKENEEAIAGLQDELKTLAQSTDLLKDTTAQMDKQMAAFHQSVKEPNLVLARKHLKEIKEAWGVDKK